MTLEGSDLDRVIHLLRALHRLANLPHDTIEQSQRAKVVWDEIQLAIGPQYNYADLLKAIVTAEVAREFELRNTRD
ncbi:MAG: hypothetical protein RIS70_2362 [Planctomycetota bacterium]|jgi:hypothetical protein